MMQKEITRTNNTRNCQKIKLFKNGYHQRLESDIPLFGDIRWAYLPELEGSEHIQQGLRPVLIVSNDANNKAVNGNVHVIPFTSKHKKYIPTHVYFPSGTGGLKVNSILLAECERQIPKCYIYEKTGSIRNNNEIMELVIQAIMIQHGFDNLFDNLIKLNKRLAFSSNLG